MVDDGYSVVVSNRLLYISFSDLDGALLSGPDCDRNVNTNLLAEAGSSQDGGDAGMYSRIYKSTVRVRLRGFEDWEVIVYMFKDLLQFLSLKGEYYMKILWIHGSYVYDKTLETW